MRTETTAPQRIAFIDAVRGLAVLLMIAVHTTDAFLAIPFRQGWLWSQVNIIFGFVAPAFLFFSGITLYLAVIRRKESGHSLLDLLRRALLILALGYWLHIPSHSLRRALDASPVQTVKFFDSDILHVIALSMLLVLVVVVSMRNVQRTSWVVLGLGLLIAAVTPFVWNAGFVESLPLALELYLSPTGSFPLFPYAAYFLIGFGGSAFLLHTREKEFGPPGIVAVGIGLIFASYLLQLLLSSMPPFDSFWYGSPALVLFRLGGILFVTGGTVWLESLKKEMSWLERTGGASLAIYVLHLMLVYGSPVTKGMQYWFDGTVHRALAPLQTIALFIAVTVVTLLAVDTWRRFRERNPRWAVRLAWGWWIGFGGVFLIAG